MSSPFDADYYLRGKETGKSNYQDYRWMPDASLAMVDHLKRDLCIKDGDTLLDVGCARGYLVKAMRMRGVEAFGYDISQWAIDNCDPGVQSFVSTDLEALPLSYDFVIAKDVMEHIPRPTLRQTLRTLIAATRKKMLLIVPLTWHEDGPFLRDEDNADPTHVIAWPLTKWMELLHELVGDEGIVTGSWHYPGLKPASSQVPQSCGFLQFTRV